MSEQNSGLPNSANLDAWAKAAAKSAPGGNVDALNWTTPEGIVVKSLYTQLDTAGLAYTDTLPGMQPFVRGPQATMYAVRPWTIRQYAGFFHRRSLQCLLPQGAGCRWSGRIGRLRPGDTSWL